MGKFNLDLSDEMDFSTTPLVVVAAILALVILAAAAAFVWFASGVIEKLVR